MKLKHEHVTLFTGPLTFLAIHKDNLFYEIFFLRKMAKFSIFPKPHVEFGDTSCTE